MQLYNGQFQLPDSNRRVPGAILFDQATGRIVLELDDELIEQTPIFSLSSHEVLHGRLVDGSDVSLLHCLQTHAGGGESIDRRVAEAYHCRYWISGAAVQTDELFSRASFSLTDLVGWMGQRGFAPLSDFTGDEVVFSARTLPRNSYTADTPRGRLTFRVQPIVASDHRSFTFSTGANIEIEPARPITLADLFQLYGRPLQDLLTIATGRPQEVVDLQVVPVRMRGLGEVPQTSADWATVRFERWADRLPDGDPPWRERMLFSFPSLAARLSASLSSWFRLDEDVHEVRTLATGPTYRQGMFNDQRFLYAAHALEAYHRRRVGGTEMVKSKHKATIKTVVDAVPEAHRRWLKEKLAFSNELSFIQRIRELRARSCEAVDSALVPYERWDQWVRDTRNHNTHFSRGKRNARIASGTRLHALTETLLLLLDDQMLLELGLDVDERNARIPATRRFARVSHWGSEFNWSAP